jgi:glucose/arabinose dehydrogenase
MVIHAQPYPGLQASPSVPRTAAAARGTVERTSLDAMSRTPAPMATPARASAARRSFAVVWVLLVTGCGPEVLTDTRREPSPSPADTAAPVLPPVETTSPPAAPPSESPSTPPATTPAGPPYGPPESDDVPPGTADGSAEVVGTVASDIPVPWGLAELPDRTVLVTSRDEHHLYRVAVDTGKVVDLGEIPGVVSGGEGGLLGVAPSPTFASDKRIYLYYSTAVDNRVAHVTLRPGSPATLSRPTVVLSGIPRGDRHNGGRIVFGADGLLYVGTGDAGAPALARDRSSLSGKVLRMTPDGRPPRGNPFPGSIVYSGGHRNVQGLAFDGRGRLLASDMGDATADEVNWIRPGRDYGWPASEGAGPVVGVTDPVVEIDPTVGSPSGIAVLDGSVFAAALSGERLWRVPLDGALVVAPPRSYLVGELGRLRSVLVLSDSRLLVSTSNTDGRGVPRPGDDRLVLVAAT